MDVDDEWELLSDDGFLQINDDGACNQIYSRSSISSAVAFQMNYFICPPPADQFVETTPRPPTRILPLPIDLPPLVEVTIDQDPVSQVFFKKIMETDQFVDMKVDSPKPSAAVPQIEPNFQFEEQEEEESEIDWDMEEEEKEREVGLDSERDSGEGGANVWKWSLNGIGAICSFGAAAAAAATFCIIVFTTTNSNKHHHHHRNQKLQFRIYSDDKRMKAIAGVSGVPISRARITVGGYYNESI